MAGRWTLLLSYWTTRARRFRSRAELEAWQDARVKRFLAKVLPRSPFYRAWVGDRPLDDWKTFPIVDKATLMARFDDWNTAGVRQDEAVELALRAERTRDFAPTLRGVTVGLSSGTSGARGLFLASPRERFAWAGAALAKVLPGPLWDRHEIAFFLRANSNLYASVRSRRIRFEFYDLLDSLEQHVARLNAQSPTLLVGPPSLLRRLAEARAAGDLRVEPRKVVSVAEVLDPLDQRVIAAAFGPTVHQAYQATEGFLGCTCPHGTLHLNEDLLVVQKEWLDHAKRKFVPVVTDFNRTTQPIVRYRLDDVLSERRAPCPCGSVLTALERVEGRCDDVFFLRSREGAWKPVFPDFVSRAVLSASDTIEAYTVRQLSPDRVTVSLKPATDQDAPERAVRSALLALCDRLACVAPAIAFVPWSEPARGLRKLKRVERCFPEGALDER